MLSANRLKAIILSHLYDSIFNKGWSIGLIIIRPLLYFSHIFTHLALPFLCISSKSICTLYCRYYPLSSRQPLLYVQVIVTRRHALCFPLYMTVPSKVLQSEIDEHWCRFRWCKLCWNPYWITSYINNVLLFVTAMQIKAWHTGLTGLNPQYVAATRTRSRQAAGSSFPAQLPPSFTMGTQPSPVDIWT